MTTTRQTSRTRPWAFNVPTANKAQANKATNNASPRTRPWAFNVPTANKAQANKAQATNSAPAD
jgi:hypothetical protein